MDTQTIIILAIALIGWGFNIYASLQKPQEKITKTQDQLDKQQALDQQDATGKAAAIALQVQFQKESNEKRFAELQGNLDEAMKLALNHTHSIESKLDGHIVNQNARNETFSNQLIQIKTILEERLPAKK